MSMVGAATGDLMDIKGFVQNLPCPLLASGSRKLAPPLTGDSTQESRKVELALVLAMWVRYGSKGVTVGHRPCHMRIGDAPPLNI